MTIYKTPALIYKRKAYNETDTLLTTFTPLGKKFLKIKNNLLKRFYLSSYAHVNLIVGKRTAIDRIYESEIVADFKYLSTSIDKMKLAGYFYQTVDKLSLPEDQNSDLFHVLLKYLYLLKNCENSQLLKKDFEKEVLQSEGIYGITNHDFEAIIEGYRKGVFDEFKR